jgi:hypothetical protein
MKTLAAPTLDFGEAGSPSNDVKPVAVKSLPRCGSGIGISAMEAIFMG